MTGVVFTHTLRRNWRQILYWGLGMGLLAWYIMAIIPNVEMLEQMMRLLETMPPALMAAFGSPDIAALTTPDGFMGFAYFTYTGLLMSVWALVAGLNVTAVEEDRGIMDMLLSTPISRAQLVIEKLLAYVVVLVAIIVLSYVCMLLGTTFSLPMDMGKLLAGSLNMIPAGLTVLGFSAMVGALVRSRSTALVLAVVFVVASYFIDFIGNAASGSAVAALRAVSYYSYYGGSQFASTGIVPGNVLLLTVAGIVLGAISVVLFRRRDIGL